MVGMRINSTHIEQDMPPANPIAHNDSASGCIGSRQSFVFSSSIIDTRPARARYKVAISPIILELEWFMRAKA